MRKLTLLLVCLFLFCSVTVAMAGKPGMSDGFEAPGFENPGWLEVVDEGSYLNDQGPCLGPVGDKGFWCLDARSDGNGISKATYVLDNPVDSSIVSIYSRLNNYAMDEQDVLTPIQLLDSDGSLLVEVSYRWVYPVFQFFAKYWNGSEYIIGDPVELTPYDWRRIELAYDASRGYCKCKVENYILCNADIQVEPNIQELSLGVCYNDTGNVAIISTALVDWSF